MSRGESVVEGQLVDLFDVAQKTFDQTGSGNINSAGSIGAVGSINSAGNSSSAKNSDTSTHLGDSAGTYNHPGAVAGSSDTASNMAGAGGNTGTGRTGNSTAGAAGVGGTGSTGAVAGTSVTASNSSSNTGNGSFRPITGSNNAAGVASSSNSLGAGSRIDVSKDSIRSQLETGVPAAVYSNGQSYVLAVDGRQLATYAGDNVRVIGHVGGSNVLTVDRVEVRDPGGAYRQIALNKPSGSNNGTAGVK